MLTRIINRIKYISFIIDVIFILISIVLAFIIRLDINNLLSHDQYFITIIFMVIFYLIILYIMDVYNVYQVFRSITFAAQFSFAFIIITLCISVSFYLIPQLKYGRGVLVIQLAFSFVLLYLWRVLFEILIHPKVDKIKIAIISKAGKYKDIVKLVRGSKYYSFAGFISQDKGNKSKNILGNINNVIQIVDKNKIDALVVTPDYKDKNFEKNIIQIKMKGLMVYDIPLIYEMICEKVPVSHISDFWIIFNTFSGILYNVYNKGLKRVFDILCSLIILIITSVIILFTSIIIKLTSRGPVFYKQVRVGFDEKHIKIIKFRSMKTGAEDKTGAVWASENDPRVTFIGRIIRKIRIDELPQLINVLKGDMSLIGPRPERPEFVEDLKKDIPYYSLRHVIKPGLTGWAQINYQYGASKEDALEKLQYDLYYIKHLSFVFDLKILLRTIRVILFGIGAR